MSKGIGGHHSANSGTDEWLTPPDLLAKLGTFDLDPCAPIVRPWSTAADHLTLERNGLTRDWGGRVWCNPPYSDPSLGKFLAKMKDHNRGLSLIFARTETANFFRYVWRGPTALLFLEGRLFFHYGVDTYDKEGKLIGRMGERAKHNAGGPSVLCAYGQTDAELLGDLAEGMGHFHPLLLPRAFAVLAIEQAQPETWREIVAGILRKRGPVRLEELYRAIGGHAKASGRKHYREQVRKVLQQGPFNRVAPGIWAHA